MPIYEYLCSSCEHEFELLLKSASDSSRTSCPSCGGDQIERRLSVFAAGASAASSDSVPAGACGRCGDPNGPCSM